MRALQIRIKKQNVEMKGLHQTALQSSGKIAMLRNKEARHNKDIMAQQRKQCVIQFLD